ncbi:MAG TPA: hypothetical protein VFH39_00460 [Candidatus Saccharimonadales bacterium]|nr:hypothetical protein [Candidatus Saccharimonadales bacterium]
MFEFASILGFGVFAFILLVIVWVALAFLPASIAHNKGHSFIGWFIISLFFWWITLFVALFLPNRNQPA